MDEERRSLPLRQRSSSKSRRSQQGSLESLVRKESPERAQRAKDDVFNEVAGRAWPTAREVGEVRGQFTTIKSNEMKPMNLQEEVRKVQGARESGQRCLSHGGRGELGHHVQR